MSRQTALQVNNLRVSGPAKYILLGTERAPLSTVFGTQTTRSVSSSTEACDVHKRTLAASYMHTTFFTQKCLPNQPSTAARQLFKPKLAPESAGYDAVPVAHSTSKSAPIAASLAAHSFVHITGWIRPQQRTRS